MKILNIHAVLWLCCISLLLKTASAQQADIDLVKSRIHAGLSASPSESTITNYQATLLGDGTWSDVDYDTTDRFNWTPVNHLNRLQSMSQMYVFGSMQSNATLRSDILLAYDAWITHDPQSDNWWHNEIWTPRMLGQILILIEGEVSPTQLSDGTTIIARSYQPRTNNEGTNTGANRTDRAYGTLMRALLTDDADLTTEAFLSMADTISINTPAAFGEGIQPDWSYCQHGPLLYIGGYGTVFMSSIYKYAEYGADTQFSFSDRKIRILTDELLEGIRWFIRGNSIEHTANGRSISRSGQSANATYLSSALPRAINSCAGYRQEELEAFNANMSAVVSAGEAVQTNVLVGNRNFWASDMMVHHRPAASVSVKTCSTRTLQPEHTNNEGIKSLHQHDGVTLIQRTGNEYDDIMPVWNWYRLPGTTVEQAGYSLWPEHGSSGTSTHAGGVSDGTDGAVAFDYSRRNVSAKKSWFFVGDVMVALGADVDAPSSTSPVLTSLNQTLLNGTVTYKAGGITNTLSGTNTPTNVEWVHHDEVGYFFPAPVSDATMISGTQTGSWFLVNEAYGSTAPISEDVFSLHINHGSGFTGDSYAYLVASGLTPSNMDQFATANYVIIKNDSTAQCVRDVAANKSYANFWAAGTAGGLTSDGKASVIWQSDADFLDVTVSDPTQAGTGYRTIEFSDPVGGLVRADGPITVEQLSPTLRIKFAMSEAYGRSVSARFFLQTNAFRTVSLSPAADTYVHDGNPTNNYGSGTTLVCKDIITEGYTRDAILQFDLAGITNTLVGASLRLTPVGVSTSTMHCVRSLPTNDWTETSLTWSNQPSQLEGPGDYWSPVNGVATSSDVLDSVTNRSGNIVEFVVSAHEQLSQAYVTYASKENGTPARRPTLELVVPWSDSQPQVQNAGRTPSGLGEVTLAGLLSSGRVAEAWICWGDDDPGIALGTGVWDNVISVGTVYESYPLEAAATGLIADVTYWCRVYVTNSLGEDWSDSATSFSAPQSLEYSMQITFTNFLGRGVLTNFPALVKLTTDNTAAYTGFLPPSGGYDLRFWTNAALSGTALNYEIESFDTNGNSCVWVQVPLLEHNASIWASWGNWSNANQEAYTTNGSVWDSDFVGVWHLDEAVGGTTARDSTVYSNHGTIEEPPGAQAESGLIHNGYHYDGVGALQNDGPVDAGNDTSLQVNAMTISGWFDDAAASERNGYISKGKTAVNLGYSNWELYSAADGSIGFAATENDDTQAWSISGGTSGGGWRYVSAAWDGSTSANAVRVYVDGTLVTQGTSAGATLANTRRLYLGAQVGPNDGTFKGTMDEVRLSASARSEDWIWASWMNQGTNHESFVYYGRPNEVGGIAAPSFLTATFVSPSRVDLTWQDNSTNETGFVVERSQTSGSGFAIIGTTLADVHNYSDMSVSPENTYYYQITATNGTNSSVASLEASVVVTNWPYARPFIWVRNSDRSEILTKMSGALWANSVYSQLVDRASVGLTNHQANPDAYIRELPIIWTASPPEFRTIPAYDESSVRSPTVNKFNQALDCAVLYYLTQDPDYAQCAADILHNSVQALLAVTPSSSTGNGGWIFQDDYLKEARVTGCQLPVVYDFLYDFLQSNQVYDVASTGMVSFSFVDGQECFRTFYELARDHGTAANNWSALMSVCMMNNALALDSTAERDASLDVFLVNGTAQQASLDDDYVHFANYGDIWPESLQYANGVATIRTFEMEVMERYDAASTLFDTYPNLPLSLSRIPYFRYPNGDEQISFGDGHRYTDGEPFFDYELAYAHALSMGHTNLTARYGALINAGIAAGDYDRSVLEGFIALGKQNTHLQLLWFASAISGEASPPVLPRTDAVPFAGITLQRNVPTTNAAEYGLMCFVGGASFTHSHASGMSMELYGMGQVMGAKAGRSTYQSTLHENYYRLFAANNTVIVNGGSRGQGDWEDLGLSTVTKVSMEPEPFEEPISSNVSFTCSSFADNKGSLAEATQQRTMVIVRTSETNGFYVDLFRSKSTVQNRTAVTLDGPVTDEYHDYIYRNIGVINGSVETNGTALPLYAQASRFQNDIGDSYDQPGWRYYSNTVVSYPHEAQVRAQYEAVPTGGTNIFMDMHMPAISEREVAKVDSPPIAEGPAPYDSAPAETLVVRQIGDTWEKPFVTVFEPHYGESGGTITNTTPLWRSGTVVGVRVDSVLNGSNVTHFVISNPGADETYSDPAADLYFTGRLGVVADYGPGNYELYIGDGTSLSYQGELIGLAQMTVPEVVGMVQASAEDAITATNLVVGSVSSVYDEVVASGSVISQNPTGGVVLAEGSSVDLVVSLGPAPAPSAYRLLFSDNFDSSDSGDVSAGVAVPGRQSGDLATATYDEWYTAGGISIASGELLTGSNAGLAGNLDFRSSLTNAALFDGFTMRFDMRNTGSSWVAYFLSTHTGVDDRGGSEFGFHVPQDGAGNGVILYGGIGAGQVSTAILRSTLTSALGSTFNASDLHDYRFVATPVTDTTGTYDFYVDDVLIHSGKDYVLGPGGGNGEINWESRVITGGNGYLDNLEVSTFIIPPAGTVLIVR